MPTGYASVEEALADTFVCTRRDHLRVTRHGCAGLFIKANGRKAPHSWEGMAACRGCPLGARHAGRKAAPPKDHPLVGAVCVRCLRQSAHLVWKKLCPSCDARQGEVRRGKNAKGTRPRMWAAKLAPRTVMVQSGDNVIRQHFSPVASWTEAMLLAGKALPLSGPTALLSRPATNLSSLLAR